VLGAALPRAQLTTGGVETGPRSPVAPDTPAGDPAGVDVAPGWAGSARVAEVGVLLVVVSWAANFIVVKAANQQIPPVAFAFLRFASAAALVLVLLRWREGSIRMPWVQVRPILVLGAIGFGGYQILWATALQSIPAGDSAFLIAATPVLTAIFAAWAGSDTLTPRKLAGALISFVGVGVVVAGGPGLGLGASLVGDVLTLGAAVCWAFYTSWGAPVLTRHSPLRVTAWAMVGGSVVLLPLGLVQAAGTDWATVTPGAWAGFIYSAVIPAGLANVVVFHGIRLLGPTRITALQFLVPFIAVLMGAAFLAEAIQPAQLAGGVVIVLGVAISRAFTVGGLAGRLRAWWVP
jgi:drug/metabolite transporter (DMT)-like permease